MSDFYQCLEQVRQERRTSIAKVKKRTLSLAVIMAVVAIAAWLTGAAGAFVLLMVIAAAGFVLAYAVMIFRLECDYQDNVGSVVMDTALKNILNGAGSGDVIANSKP